MPTNASIRWRVIMMKKSGHVKVIQASPLNPITLRPGSGSSGVR